MTDSMTVGTATAQNGPTSTLARVPAAGSLRVRADMDIRELGEVFAASGFFPDARKQAQAIVKILAGQELGISPMASMTGIYVIPSSNGNSVMIGSSVMAGKVRSSDRYDYDVVESSQHGVEIVFWRCKNKNNDSHDLDHKNGCRPLGRVSVSLEEMKKSGVAMAKDGKRMKRNWKADPEAMCFNRAISRGVKKYCPDVLQGAPFVTEGELDDEIIEATGRAIPTYERAAEEVVGRHVDSVADDDDIVIEDDGSAVNKTTGEVIGSEPRGAEPRGAEPRGAEPRGVGRRVAAEPAATAPTAASIASIASTSEPKTEKTTAEAMAGSKFMTPPEKTQPTSETTSIFNQRQAELAAQAAKEKAAAEEKARIHAAEKTAAEKRIAEAEIAKQLAAQKAQEKAEFEEKKARLEKGAAEAERLASEKRAQEEAARIKAAADEVEATKIAAEPPSKPAPEPEPEKPIDIKAPDPAQNVTVLEDHVIAASKIPDDLLAMARKFGDAEIPMDAWQRLHMHWLMEVAPGKKKDARSAYAMAAWTRVDITKANGKRPTGAVVLALVRNVGVDLALAAKP